MEIKILGTGCAKFKSLERLTREVVESNGIQATISKVEDITEILKYHIMATPALCECVETRACRLAEIKKFYQNIKSVNHETINILVTVLVVVLNSISNGQVNKKRLTNVSSTKELFYFHFTRRSPHAWQLRKMHIRQLKHCTQ
jgi:hypothetical protein